MLATSGYCDRHRVAAHRDYGRARRGFDAERTFYQSAAWRALRAAFLFQHPVCCRCEAAGRIVAAVVADHVLPIKDGGARLDEANLQALCVPCHNSKTASETALRSRRLAQ
ncbi:MAG: HNH endonuclease signature motif containing protein [Burkholderiaceae bacterium]